jgi:hypothetical protein
MYNTNIDINVLVNGNRCKLYHHQNKVFIEAKHNSEYELEIKNNHYSRVLALTSVDGLSVLTGKPAEELDPGYVIPPHSSHKIKGFRYSNDEVAAFKFVNKESSYAQSTGGTELSQNCGVIGFKIYNEVYYNINIGVIGGLNNSDWNTPFNNGHYVNPYSPYLSTCMLAGQSLSSDNNTSNMMFCCDASINNQTSCLSEKSFDMGSAWGKRVESKVVETEFKRQSCILNLDIYYASRESLIKMGIPVSTQSQVSFPQSFPKKFATPPVGWVG